MTTAGPNFPDSGASQGTGVSWSTPGNVSADDGSTAVTSVALASGSTLSAELYASDYDFAIPSGATIDGITVVIEGSRPTGGVDDSGGVWVTKDGTVTGADLQNGTDWTSTPTARTYGGATSLWSQSWTDSEINATTFGVITKCRRVAPGGSPIPAIDYITVTVDYTEAAGGSAVASVIMVGV